MRRFNGRFLIVVMLVMVGMSGSLFAKIPTVPKAQLDEIYRLVDVFKADKSNQKNRFELSMTLASNGFIEEAWTVLKPLSPSYAMELVGEYEALQAGDPTNWKYPFRLGFIYFFLDEKSKDYTRSIVSFKQVLVLYPDHVWTMGFIALVLGLQDQPSEAIKWCQRALKLEPNAMPIHALIALGYGKQNNYLKALGHGLIVGRLKTEYAVAGYRFDL